MVAIKVKKLEAAAQVPRYAHVGEFGDLAADLYASAAMTLEAGATAAVPTGIALEFPLPPMARWSRTAQGSPCAGK